MIKIENLVIGAGPAGLSAAYELNQAKRKVIVLEKDPIYVGGLARTVKFDGYRIDLGGHRFFTKSKEVQSFWEKILGDHFIYCKRLSRIYYKQKFFKYPLNLKEIFFKLGFIFTLKCFF